MRIFIFFLFISPFLQLAAQDMKIPNYLKYDEELNSKLKDIIMELKLDRDFEVGEDGIEQVSIAVIDLNTETPKIAGYKMNNLIYPASVYKMYVAAAALMQISNGEYSLSSPHIVKEHNAVDRSREISWDPRPLLKPGDTVTVNYLIDLMITRSDNSAANCMIDIAKRPRINEMMHNYEWYGSEVTRKFLKRKFEDEGYAEVTGTMTCALHAADFMYRIYSNQLVNSWVSRQMFTFLGRQLDNAKIASGLPANSMYYNKTGWFSYWTNDVGIVLSDNANFVISVFLPITEKNALPIMKELSAKIYKLFSERKK